ncbi:tRNA (adenosine(37)-N6)-threonylcarbamoyltransferase complex dimerization subunit type 1 TsaB [Pseudogracilibacillus sp. SE30717A]|uniref:tRNA (adenosine(37)-N6)-threonylcarbamoyltransferase complex dimerization subunit type 1 TsaB n=1 Tax=Pseudogracilibacillus sp. SE30717A TaxID=3098293 RepID=UPI00300E3865
MNILAIDTSNQVLGIALIKNNELIAELITNLNKDHSSRLMPAIVEIMEKTELKPEMLDKIIVANGPGSYTGTRIGVTTAKTLAWTLNIPIYTVSSLATVAMNGVFFDGYICPFFDARRKSVFTGLYKWENKQLNVVKKETNIDMMTWLESLKEINDHILFLSPHIHSFQDMITSSLVKNASIPSGSIHLPRPSNLVMLSEQIKESSVHLVSPNYLRITEAESNLLIQQKDEHSHG